MHDWARAYRQQILVAVFTLVGLALVIGFWAGPNPSLVLFALATILAVVEIVLVSNLVAPTRTQELLRLLHDWARAYRRQILVAIFTLVGLALVAQGVGSM